MYGNIRQRVAKVTFVSVAPSAICDPFTTMTNPFPTHQYAIRRRLTVLPFSFRTNTERLASMSPAARKLAAKHLLSPRLKLTPNNMGILSHATPKRTPTPHRRPLVTTPNSRSTRPSNAGSVNNSASLSENNNLTDNLLQINVAKRSRLKAQDFFAES